MPALPKLPPSIPPALVRLSTALLIAVSVVAARADGNAQTSLKVEDLDAAVFAEWNGDGGERTLASEKDGPKQALWTRNSRPDLRGVTFGESAAPGIRHLRCGFKTPVAVGSVLVRGGGQLSALKTGAAYPGDLARETDWLPAERIKSAEISHEEVGREELAIWTFPPGTTTRALRFTHLAPASDTKYGGWLGGALIWPDRLANIAPQAQAVASAGDEVVAKINNEKDESWKTWDNGKEGAAQPVSPEHPEWLMLVWPRAVLLSGLETLWTGFSSADVQIFTGPATTHPREAGDAEWKTLKSFSKLENGYPLPLWPNALEFDQAVTTRAVRLRLTGTTTEGHPHLKSHMKDGKRVWLGELMALQPIGKAELKTALLPTATIEEPHPPIPVRFKLAEPGYVTLVIEDAAGKRVRNLVSETRFPAGENVAWWDGTDDLGRDRDAARHGLYHIPEQPVAPGAYRVRGLSHKGLELRYEFSIYNAGNPAWSTADTAGGWLTNHTPPQAVIFVPAEKTPNGQPMIYLGSAVSEGGAGLAWVDLDGKKLGGRGWIGGNWTAAPTLARDEGKNAVPEVFAYVGATWTASTSNADKTHGELRLTALTAKGDKPVLKYPFTPPAHAEGGPEEDNHWIGQLGGIAVRDGLLVASLHKLGLLLFVDAQNGKVLGEAPVESPRGLAFDAQGRLLVLSGTKLLRFSFGATPLPLPHPQTVIGTKPQLEAPQGLTTDATGRIYISDHGDSHQVKVFSAEGKFLAAIGRAGAPKAGSYDPVHMNNPHGLAIDEKQRLWVTENDFQPKRVSVWTLDGKLERAFYGPGRYGGGGTLDPQEKTRFYYDGMEFKLDWKTGANEPVAIFSRSGKDDVSSLVRAGPPQTPIYAEGRQYMTNCYNSNPTGGHPHATIWLMKDSVAVPVAALGRANDWELLKGDQFKPRWPEGVDLQGDRSKNSALFVWSDANGDGRVQPDEVTMSKATTGGVTVAQDLSFLVARVDEKAMRFAPRRFTPQGVPFYELGTGETLASGAQSPASSGGDQVLISPGGWTVLTVAPQPLAREGFGGVKNGEPLWSYPSLWPGLHASHEAPVSDRPGEVIGSTRLLGDFVTPQKSDAGPLWCINGNSGTLYLLTADGLFVAQLFQDGRVGKPWSMPKAERGTLLNEVTLHDENFFPTITQTSDGLVYLCDGARTSLVRVDGLENIRRLPVTELRVTADDLKNATAWRGQAEAQRQAARGSGTLNVALRKEAPVVDGKLDDWAGADWAVIDRRGTAANFNSDSKPYDLTGAVAIAGDRLYAAFRTQDAELLKNSGETPNAPFKTGGCLDLMLGANPAADPKRPRPVAGDERLLVTQVGGKTLALLYRAVVPGTKEPVPFSSPWRTITIDRVDDVSAQVQLATSIEKNDKGKVASAFYELSVPLSALGLKAGDGQSIKADLGILRGNGFQTLQRVYWNNKATAITADVPSEAELTPALWGKWLFKAAP
ncbi:MAG: hypothetical protein QOE70_5328 [Chthoniobacter sp.]|jgi:hypothetical protein|nr:hypothetical protein [Chthoniobacter sp.]